VVGQKLLVAVDPDQVLEGAGDSRLAVGLELGHVDDDVGFDDRPRHEVAVTSRRVGLPHLARVVLGDPE